MSYDPKACGAQCDLCPLQGKTVVPPELPTQKSRQSIVILGEAPGEEEEKLGRPFVGPSGNELGRALRAAQINRHESLVTNTLLCRPENNDLETFLRKAKKKAAEEGVPFHHPVDCCKPRLEQEIKGYINFITLGKVATRAVAGTQGGILKIRGGFMELEADMTHPYRRVMPTVHPAFVLRAQKWRHVFRNDIFKASRWFRGVTEWVPPEITYDITPEEVDAWLAARPVWGYDLETDGIEPLTARIRCISFATATEAIVITFMSLEPGRKGQKIWPPTVEQRYIEVFKKYFEDPNVKKVAHNGMTYDNPVLKKQWGIDVKGTTDTLLVHKGVESELSHSLGYVVSLYTEAPSWKNDREGSKLSTDSESDRQLAEYCALDSALMMRVYPTLLEQLQLRDQVDVCRNDHKMQIICASMHEVGMYVDEAARQAKEKELLKSRWETLAKLREHPDVHPEFNPSSVYQIRDLLFDKWKLVPDLKDEDRLTKAEDPSTADLVLRALLTDRKVPEDKREFIKILRRFRKLIKVLGTYVLKMRPRGILVEEDLGWDEDDDWVDRETRKRYGLAKEGIVDPYTGRMHPGFSAGLPVTGRLSSFKPMNAMNYPGPLRSLVTHSPGNILVGADMDQLELRVAAALWDVELYKRAFREGKDPHSMTAYSVFGEEYLKEAGIVRESFFGDGIFIGEAFTDGVFDKNKASKNAASMRSLSKAVQYASVSAGTGVSVLDDRRVVPIETIKAGDWVWAWSNQRKRYEPAQVKQAWPHGPKPCVRVTFSWKGKGGPFTDSVVVTGDHPMLLRNGKIRHAHALSSGDRLLPFRRQAYGKYASVAPFNDGQRVGEHRIVKGFYAAGDRDTHVHHKDGNPLNNHPDNLEVLDHLTHYTEHKEAVDAGRVRSAKWRASVSNPETRSAASKKAWEGRRERQATDRTFGKRESKLDAFTHLIGVKTDVEVAALAGCTQELVGMYRKEHGISPPVGQKGWLRWLLTNDVLWHRLLHDHTDTEIVRLIKETFDVEVSRSAVKNTRQLLAVPAVQKDRKETYPRKESPLDAYADRMGHEKDAVIAAEAGVTRETVASYRKARGIPLYWKEGPGGDNHTVVSVEPAGVHEVWDLEVNHEDHNFALDAGIFVHNSQYMGSVETVHKLVCKTEVPAIDPKTGKPYDDGSTDLPYALMKLRRVREMREKWLSGAPQFSTGWEKEINEYRVQGFLREPVHGRRRDFMDGEDPNQIVNFKIQCHEGSTRVLTDSGWVQIQELVGKSFQAWTGHRWAPAVAVHKGRAPIYTVATKSDFRVRCDGSHGLKVVGENEYTWRAVAGEGLPPLRENDLVAMAMATSLEFPNHVDLLTEEEAWVLGFWVGNGCTYKGAGCTGVQWTVGCGRSGRREGDYMLTRLENFAKEQQWHLNKRMVPNSSTTLVATRGDGINPQDWLRKAGVDPLWTSHTKRVPRGVLQGSLAVRRAFLKGLLDADGYMSPCWKVTLHLCQRPLLEDVALVARSVGVPPNFLHGPYEADRKGHLSWRLALNAARCKSELSWGVGGKLRTSQESSAPHWELDRVLPSLKPTCDSDKVVRSRIKKARTEGEMLNVSPYMLQRMGAQGLYDHEKVATIEPTNEVLDVYTLSVFDPEHQYVAEGFISKNSGAAGLMNTALINLFEEIERRKKTHNWGPHTGVINQCHDSIVIECPERESEVEWTKQTLEACMNQTHPKLPGVVFSASATVGNNWKKVG